MPIFDFRARDTDGNYWYSNDELHFSNQSNDMEVDLLNAPFGITALEQYSGLRSNNNTGTKIYVNDVVYIAGYGEYTVEFPFTELYEAIAENDVGVILGYVHLRRTYEIENTDIRLETN